MKRWTQPITTRVSDATAARIAAIARDEDVTEAAVIRRLVREALERKQEDAEA